MRLLFDPSGAPVSNLTDASYLSGQILDMQVEIDRLGVDHGGFETEAYGRGTPLHDYMRGNLFVASDYDACVGACKNASNATGWVWGVTPAGTYKKWHPYMALAQNLGHNQMAQGTYYDRPREIEDVAGDYSYNVAGMFVNTHKENPNSLDKKFFLPSDVMKDRTAVWSKTAGGVWVWTWGNDIEVSCGFLDLEAGR